MSGYGFDINKFKKLKMIFGTPAGSELMEPLYVKWGTRYLVKMKRRFIDNSRGGGDWPPLAEATIAARMRKARRLPYARKRGITGKYAILVDTGILRNALGVGAFGNLFEPHALGIRVGYGGAAMHPKGKAKIADIASFHNSGTARLPQRRIIWPPDADLRAFMARTLQSHIAYLMRGL